MIPAMLNASAVIDAPQAHVAVAWIFSWSRFMRVRMGVVHGSTPPLPL